MSNVDVTVTVRVKDEALAGLIEARGDDLNLVGNALVKQALRTMLLEPQPINAGPFTLHGDLNSFFRAARSITGSDSLMLSDTATVTVTFSPAGDAAPPRLGVPVPPSA